MSPEEGAAIYAALLVPGDHIVDAIDQAIIGKFRHLLPAALRRLSMDLEPTVLPGVWLVVALPTLARVRSYVPFQRERAVA